MASEKKEMDIIDLIKEFFSWIGRIIKSIGMGFLYFVRFSFQNIKILLLFFALGIVAAVILSTVARKYESDMTLKLNVANCYDFNDLTKSLDVKLVSDIPLAQRLNVPDSIADAIDDIKGHYIVDNFNNGTPDWVDYEDIFEETDTLNVRMLDRLVITVRSSDMYAFPKIQEGLVYFYSNDVSMKKARELLTKQQHQALGNVNRELKRLDSLSNYEYFNEPKYRTLTLDSQALLLGEKPKQLYYGDIAKLQVSRDSLEDLIENSNEIVTVLKSFTVSKKPVRNLPKMLVYCTLVFVFLGYITALYVRYKKQVWGFLNEKK